MLIFNILCIIIAPGQWYCMAARCTHFLFVGNLNDFLSDMKVFSHLLFSLILNGFMTDPYMNYSFNLSFHFNLIPTESALFYKQYTFVLFGL